MDCRNTNCHSSKTTIATPIDNKNRTTVSSFISTQRHFKVNKRSSDKSALPNKLTYNKPSNVVPNKPSCKLAEIDSTKTESKNYSSRNMLRTSRLTTPIDKVGQSGPLIPNDTIQERSTWQDHYDLKCYTTLNEGGFTFEYPHGIECLICGMAVKERTVDRHNNTSQHLSQFKKLDLKLLYENLDESSLQMSTIGALCDKWISTYSLTNDMVENRNYAIKKFQEILGSINPECQLRLHGSSYYDVALRPSDVNLELIHPNSKLFESDPRSKRSIHHQLIDPNSEFGNQFNHHTMHYDLASNPVETLYKIHRIMSDSSRSLASYPFEVCSSLSQLNLKIPNITLKHRSSGSLLNVNCFTGRRFNLAELFRTYMLLDSRLKHLIKLVRVWAKFCSIDNPDLGGYPPHAYVVMMIHFLQRTEPPVLPCLQELVQNVKRPDQPTSSIDRSEEVIDRINEVRDDELDDEEEDLLTSKIDENFLRNLDWRSENKSPVHALFIQFLRAMIDEFSRTSEVMTIRTLEIIPSQFNTQSKVIEHPINQRINISRCLSSMKTFDFIRDSFFHSYFYLTSLPIDGNLKPRKIIMSDPRDYIRLYINKVRLDSYRAMKGSLIGQANYDPITQMIQQKLFAREVEALHALSVSKPGVSIPKTLANLYDPGFFRPQNITYSYSCRLCRSTGHSREKCPKGFIETLKHDLSCYDFDLDQTATLDSLLMDLYRREMISPSLSLEHQKVLGVLKRIINEALDLNLSFVLYGSTINNLGSCDSDLDICVTVKDNPTGKNVDCVKILQNILKVLETIIDVHDIQPVFSARVPIIRFKFGNFDIDLSMYNQCAIYNSKLLKSYSLINPKVAPLCFLVKKFAKACGIADASRGGLSSYGWSLLVIYYLQRLDPPMLPVLQEPIDSPVRGCFGVNGWNVWFHDKQIRLPDHPYDLTQLLKGFFLFYGTFDFENAVVSIRKSKQMTKFQKSWNGCMIAIEDPFELTYNLSNRLSDPMAIFILKHIVKIQRSIDSGTYSNISQSKLSNIMFNGRDITNALPPLRGCLVCHKIGHKLKECPERYSNTNRSPRKNKGNTNFPVGKWKK